MTAEDEVHAVNDSNRFTPSECEEALKQWIGDYNEEVKTLTADGFIDFVRRHRLLLEVGAGGQSFGDGDPAWTDGTVDPVRRALAANMMVLMLREIGAHLERVVPSN